MLTPEQGKQRQEVLDAITYIMENGIKGNLILSFPGNGNVGAQGKLEYFFGIGKGQVPLKDMERLRSMKKNIVNQEAAKRLKDLAGESS